MTENNSFPCSLLKKEGMPHLIQRKKNINNELGKDPSYEERIAAEKEAEEFNSVLSPEEFAKKMLKILTKLEKYPESTHKASDYLVENLLITLGYGEAIEISRSFHRWYS